MQNKKVESQVGPTGSIRAIWQSAKTESEGHIMEIDEVMWVWSHCTTYKRSNVETTECLIKDKSPKNVNMYLSIKTTQISPM